MEHNLELSIPILEILEIEVCNILQNPGNIGKQIVLIQSYPGNLGKPIFSIFSYPGKFGNWIFPNSHILEMRAAGRRLLWSGFPGLDYFGTLFLGFLDILEILEI